jgi:hypothetical protein
MGIAWTGGFPASGPLAGHGGAGACYNHSLQTYFRGLIRRGGVPSGAAAFIAQNRGAKNSLTPGMSRQFSGEIMRNERSRGFALTARHAPAAVEDDGCSGEPGYRRHRERGVRQERQDGRPYTSSAV